MEPIIIVVLINLIIVTVWDILNFPNELASSVMSMLTKGVIKNVTLKKPFGCSLCLTFWTTVIYFLSCMPLGFYNILLYTAVALFSAYFTTYTYMLINLINSFIVNCVCLISRLVNKIK